MHIIGLTGGIGSGKSLVSDLFESYGVDVSDADVASRKVLEHNPSALDDIVQQFGAECLNHDGSLNRAHLRTIVFKNKASRIWLEQLLHPLIAQALEAQLSQAQGHYAILSSPLLFETKQNLMTTRTLVVDATQDQQLSRGMQRDGNSQAQIHAIMKTQLSRKERLALADDVIDNTGSIEQTRQQVLALHEKYLQL
jgi:dephospho-CoA kinase